VTVLLQCQLLLLDLMVSLLIQQRALLLVAVGCGANGAKLLLLLLLHLLQLMGPTLVSTP
jgi:hypothetical protein